MTEPDKQETLDGSTSEDQPALPPAPDDAPPRKGPGRPKGAKNKKRKRKAKPAGADRPPRPSEKSGAEKRTAKRAEGLGKIEEVFAKVLSVPGKGMAFKGDMWAAEHFTVAGPGLARELRIECEQNPRLYTYALQAAEWLSIINLAGAVGAYLLPLLLHWNIIPGSEGIGPFLGVPVIVKDGPPPPAASPPPFMGGHQAPAAEPAPPPPPAPEPPPHDPGPAATAMVDAMAANDAAGQDPAVAWEVAGFDPTDPLAAELAGEGVPPPPVASL